MKKHVFVVEKTDTGFSAYAKEDNVNVGATGKTITEIKERIVEAFNALNEIENRKSISADNISIELNIPQFFEYFSDLIKAKGVARRIDMNHTLLSQYIGGEKTPSKKQTEKIVAGLKEVAKEILELDYA